MQNNKINKYIIYNLAILLYTLRGAVLCRKTVGFPEPDYQIYKQDKCLRPVFRRGPDGTGPRNKKKNKIILLLWQLSNDYCILCMLYNGIQDIHKIVVNRTLNCIEAYIKLYKVFPNFKQLILKNIRYDCLCNRLCSVLVITENVILNIKNNLQFTRNRHI